PRPQPTLELLLAQLPQQVGKRNLDRADDAALVAHGGGLGQVERVLDADIRRRQDRADRAWIDPSVRVPADVLVDRTVVHARAATNAAQRFLELAAENGGTARIAD